MAWGLAVTAGTFQRQENARHGQHLLTQLYLQQKRPWLGWLTAPGPGQVPLAKNPRCQHAAEVNHP